MKDLARNISMKCWEPMFKRQIRSTYEFYSTKYLIRNTRWYIWTTTDFMLNSIDFMCFPSKVCISVHGNATQESQCQLQVYGSYNGQMLCWLIGGFWPPSEYLLKSFTFVVFGELYCSLLFLAWAVLFDELPCCAIHMHLFRQLEFCAYHMICQS